MFFTRLLLMLLLSFGLMPSSPALLSANASPPTSGLLLVVNKGDQNLGLIDTIAGQQITVVAENGVTGHEVAVSPDGSIAYVPIYGNSGVGKPGTDGTKIVMIDIAARKVVGEIDFGRGVRPHCAVFGPQDKLLYVTTEVENSISVIDPRTRQIVAAIPTGKPESHMFAIARDNRRGYTSNVGSGTVSVLDLKKRRVITIIPVASMIQRISLSIDDRLVFTADQSKPQLAAIDTATNKIKTWIPLPASAYGTAPTNDGRWLLAAIPSVNKVAVIDLHTMQVARTIDVPRTPQEIIVRPDGREAYVSCDASRKVAVINTTTWSVDKLIDAGRGADGLAWTAAVSSGK